MTHASLFSGIGGFDLAAQWAGWENMFSCEINEFCNKVLKKNFPNTLQYEDIRTTDFSIWRGRVDVISLGFPCQPFSTAGKRLGKEDERHLWPEGIRVIREVAPRWVVGENVRGLISWNGGMVFDEVQADLEASGYEVQAFLLPACGVDAPHRRDRVWFVAHANAATASRQRKNGRGVLPLSKPEGSGVFCPQYAAYPNQARLSERISTGFRSVQQKKRSCAGGESARIYSAGNWDEFPTQPPVCGRNDGISNRVERIAALGNAIVPQVAYQIFKAIIEYENDNHHTQPSKP